MLATVVIPAFNSEETIGKCLNSVLRQKEPGSFEVIVVDDGSTDKTAEIVKKFRKVRLIQQKNSGPATARNNGVKQARGDVIVFTDDDCIAEQGWLKEMLTPFKDKSVSGVQGAYASMQKEFMARFSQMEIEYRYEKMKKQKFIDFIGSYSAAYRKKDFLEVNGFDSRFKIASGEDPDFSFKLAEKGKKLVFNPKAVVFHKHPVSPAGYFRTKFFRAFWRVRLYKKHSEKAVKDSYTPQLMKARIVLIGLALLAGAGSLFSSFSFGLMLGLLSVAILSTAPFTVFAAKRNFALGFFSPLILLVRDFLFLAGLGTGIVKGVWLE